MPSGIERFTGRRDFYQVDWFTDGCNLATKIMVEDKAKKKMEYEEERKAVLDKAKKRYEKAESNFKEMKKRFKKDNERYWDHENEYNLEREMFAKTKLEYQNHELNFCLKYLRYDLEPFQVSVFATFILIFSYLALAVMDAIIIVIFIMLGDVPSLFMIVLIGGITLLLPPILSALVSRYPYRKAHRLQVKTLGRLPEVINYMSMSMALNPSLNTAVEFASDNVDEPLATQLKKILWNVYIREFDSIERSFLDFASFCGRFNEEFKRALYSVRNSAIEKTKEGIERALDTANDIILEGTRRQMLGFANSLTAPTMVLFSLGILLPMIIGAMLPLLQVGSNSVPTIVLVMDVVFPGTTLMYAYHILGNRPGTSTPPDIPNPLSTAKKKAIITVSVLIFLTGLVLGILGMVSVDDSTDPLLRSISPLPIIIGFGLAIIYYSHSTSRHQKKKRDRIIQMEKEFPDALYHLGSRIAEGKAFEDSLSSTARSMEDTFISGLLKQIFYNLQVVRSQLKHALFGSQGLLKNHPSRTIKASMRTVVDSIKKDPAVAGATIIKISQYLRQMKNVEDEIDNNLSSVRGMMMTTGSIFGPIIMGITTALYQMLSESLSGIGSIGGMGNSSADVPDIGPFNFGQGFGEGAAVIAPEIFCLIIGIYLILTVLVILYFCTNIKYGNDRVELKVTFVKALPITLFTFSLSIIIANMLLV